MTEVTMTKPIVSKELAEEFETINKNNVVVRNIINSANYNGNIPENNNLSWIHFEDLLLRMYLVGYEVEKTKKYLIKSPLVDDEGDSQYIMRSKTKGTF